MFLLTADSASTGREAFNQQLGNGSQVASFGSQWEVLICVDSLGSKASSLETG